MQERLDKLMFMIKVAQEIGRPFDMIPLCKEFVALTPHLNFEERILYSQAYHDSVSSLRQSLQIAGSFLNEDKPPAFQRALANLIDKMRKELETLCAEVIETVDNILLVVAETHLDHIFYNKMKGDYWRYDAEFQTGALKEHAVEEAYTCYEIALKIAEENLDIIDPMRLGLILNYTVFLVECKGEREKGCEISYSTLQKAESIVTEEILREPEGQDVDICLKLIRDNYELWIQEGAE